MIGIGSRFNNAPNISRNDASGIGGLGSVKLWYDLYPAPNEFMVTELYGSELDALSLINRKNNSDILNSVGDSNGWIQNGSLFLQSNSQPCYRSSALPYFDYMTDGTIYLVMKFDSLNFIGNDLLYIATDLYPADVWIKISTFLDGSDPFWRFSVRNANYPEYYYETSDFQMVLHNGFVFLKIHRNSSIPFIQIYDFMTGIETAGLEASAGAGGTNYIFNFTGGNNYIYECIFEAGTPQAESFITNYLIEKYTPLL